MKVEIQFIRGLNKTFEVPDSGKVCSLRDKVAESLKIPTSHLKLIANGKTLDDEESLPRTDILAVVLPAPHDPDLQQLKDLGKQDDAEEEDDLRFKLPSTASSSTRKIARYLKRNLHVPEIILVILFQVKPRFWIGLLVWVLCAPVASILGVGPLYVLGTILALIFCNLGSRVEGEASAYSIFNNFRALPGQLTADELDRQVRTGTM